MLESMRSTGATSGWAFQTFKNSLLKCYLSKPKFAKKTHTGSILLGDSSYRGGGFSDLRHSEQNNKSNSWPGPQNKTIKTRKIEELMNTTKHASMQGVSVL